MICTQKAGKIGTEWLDLACVGAFLPSGIVYPGRVFANLFILVTALDETMNRSAENTLKKGAGPLCPCVGAAFAEDQ